MLRRAILSSTRAARSSQAFAHQRSTAPLHNYQAALISQRYRWYSAEAQATPKESAQTTTENSGAKSKSDASTPSEPSDADAALKKQVEAKDAEARDWKDKYLRSVADFRNLQDRHQREMKSARDFAIQRFAKDLVDSVDNLDRALTMVPENKLKVEEKNEFQQDLVNLYDGLKLTENILMSTLKKHGLERFDPDGEKFNPNEHEATFMVPMPDKEDNTVFNTQQKGFKLNGRVLRAAKVGVVKNK